MTDRPPALEDIFRTLDRWRHLPAYRLEPTLAPFFGLFLPEILRIEIGNDNDCIVIPEFPLPTKKLPKTVKELGKKITDRNLSVKVDYAVFPRNSQKAFLVELKTDRDSFNKEQLKYMREAREKGTNCLVEGILDICNATKKYEKYNHLLDFFAKIPLVKLHGESSSRLLPKPDTVRNYVSTCEAQDRTIKIVYITPDGKHPNGSNITNIGFECVADIVAARGGFGPMFAYYLKRWKDQAGEMDPRKFRIAP